MNHAHLFTQPRGYVALISAIVISTVLLTLTTTVSAVNFAGRENALYAEFKHTANGLAESCINQALLNIAADYSYTVAAPVVVSLSGGLECSIESVTFGAETNHQKTFTIRTKAEYSGAYSALNVSAAATDPSASPYDRGTILVRVAIINDDGGTASANATDITVPIGGNAYPSSFDGDVYWRTVTVDAGSYGIQATAISSYTLSSSSGCSGTVADGEVKQCTFTFDDTPTTGKITMNVIIVNNDGGAMTSMPNTVLVLTHNSTVVNPQAGIPTTYAPGSYTLTGAPPSGYHIGGYTGNCNAQNLAAGGMLECTVSFDDNPPPAPTCADTIMMLDRTGSMSTSDLSDERAAASSLIALYENLNPNPRMGIGRFGAIPVDAQASADLLTPLTADYTNFASLLNSGIVRDPVSATNIASAINVAQAQFIANGTPGFERVLILLSDGGATLPSGSTSQVSEDRLPSSNAPESGTNQWVLPSGAYGLGAAADNGGHSHRYGDFALNIPSGASITTLTVSAVASSTAVMNPGIALDDNFGTGMSASDVPMWLEDSTSPGSATQAQAPVAPPSDDSASPDGDRYAVINGTGGWICRSVDASAFSLVTLSYYWRGDSQASVSDTALVQVKTSGACSDTTGWTDVETLTLNTNPTAWQNRSPFILPVSNATFLLKFRNNSNSANDDLRVDKVMVEGVSAQYCQLGVSASWDGGTNWSTEQVQGLSASTATYGYTSLGGHTWAPNDFSNPNFKVRIREVQSGPTCRVDTLSAKVAYTLPTANPFTAAYAAADAAKLAGTKIFTIHFGANGTSAPGGSNQSYLALLASGSTPNAPYQPGSYNDPGGIVNGNTGLISPTGQAPEGTGFVNATQAFQDDDAPAEAIDGAGKIQQYFGYDISIPPNATITNVEVVPNWWVENTTNTNTLGIQVSWNGGSSWSSVQNTSGDSTSHGNTDTLGGMWGNAWAPVHFASGNFRVRVTALCSGGGSPSCATRDFYIDHIPVRVSYTAIAENSDSDNFFISPQAGDMPGIFRFIGEQVCPAAAAPPIITTPTSGTINVLTNVVNDSGTGTKVAADFISVVDDNGAIVQFAGNSVSPGSSVIVQDLHTYTVSVNGSHEGYDMTMSPAACASGTMVAGTVLNCTITLDDVPIPTPPPPPPPPAIDIGSWEEI
ncbi:MAG: vWA domain-containing protein [Patescibacteria group bacterium]